MTAPSRRALRTAMLAGAGVLLLSGAALTARATDLGTDASPSPAPAAGSSALGQDGQRLSATPVKAVPAIGASITVRGSGYPTFKGVYVAVCKIPPKGELPTPCGGGADTSGGTETSKWISSNPPSYGKGLAEPYGRGGTFDVTLWASPTLPDGEDCRVVGCAVVTRADHTRTSDRSQDVLIPVTFAATGDAEDGPNLLVRGGSFVIVVATAGAAGYLVARRRRPATAPASPSTDES